MEASKDRFLQIQPLGSEPFPVNPLKPVPDQKFDDLLSAISDIESEKN